jgi:hypothetical protein
MAADSVACLHHSQLCIDLVFLFHPEKQEIPKKSGFITDKMFVVLSGEDFSSETVMSFSTQRRR